MLFEFKTKLENLLQKSLSDVLSTDRLSSIEIDVPNDKAHGDFSSNVALKAAKILKKSPMDIAADFKAKIDQALKTDDLKDHVARVEVLRPGFINFYLSERAGHSILQQVLSQREQFGRITYGQGEKIQIEFVSANPTGPLSVAHARQAAVGDALGNILKFIGFEVTKEYYVNDEGNQINILGKSIQLRAHELMGEQVVFPEDCYQGEYIKDMAREFCDLKGVKDLTGVKSLRMEDFREYGLNYLLGVIRKELDDFGVRFDVWTSQSAVATAARIEQLLQNFEKKGHVYAHEGALWFKSTAYGDDKDRVVKKSDGAYTYFTPDIVYHQDKFRRGFKRVVNIWGPDHHGYIPRLTAAIEALGQPRSALQVIIVQLATIYRNGQPVSMSTRRGQYISLREVMDEVGVDAARFFFLMRRTTAHLEFDLDLAKKETPENPVFYVQYAHARVCSVLQKAKEAGLAPHEGEVTLLKEASENVLMKKIGDFSGILISCAKEMDPFSLVIYMQELATVFHRFYDELRVIDSAATQLSRERLAMVEATRIVLSNGLRLLGVAAPEKM